MNFEHGLDDGTMLTRAKDSIESAIDDYDRGLLEPALYGLDIAKGYLDEMEKDCQKKKELIALLNTYYPKVISEIGKI